MFKNFKIKYLQIKWCIWDMLQNNLRGRGAVDEAKLAMSFYLLKLIDEYIYTVVLF